MSDFIKRLTDHENLTDVLIQMEDFLDNLDLYVFKNWFKGEIIEGPIINRYWVSMKLKYAYNDMPDPVGSLRLVKHGAKVTFQKAHIKEPIEINTNNDYRPEYPGKPKMREIPIWIIEITIPRKFIEELDDDDLTLYDDVIDVDDISDARDENIDEKDAYRIGDNNNDIE